MRELVLRLLRVPADPRIPEGESVRVFRAAPNFLTWRRVLWLVTQLGTLTGLLFGLAFLRTLEGQAWNPWLFGMLRLAEIAGFVAFALQIPFTWAMLRLDYELRWYVVTDRSLRIREGITTVREKTLTFANIQNITINQGPVQRLLGIADLEVRTAGGGGDKTETKGQGLGDDLHVAFFHGVDNAPEIRDVIRERVRLGKGSGLGDPDDAHEREDDDEAAAARLLLDEVRALRSAILAQRIR